MAGVAAHLLRTRPAALALVARRAVDADDEAGDVLALVEDGGPTAVGREIHPGDDEERGQQLALAREELGEILRRGHDAHAGLEAAADELLGARRLERLGHLAA